MRPIDPGRATRYVVRAMRGPATLYDVSNPAALLDRFLSTEVVVVGDFVADEYVFGETERISREAPVLIVRYERTEIRAGCAGNAALNLAALGVKVRAVGAVGEDAVGRELLETLAANRVDVSGILCLSDRPTESKMRILAGGRSTRRQQIVRVDRVPKGPLPASAAGRLVREVRRAARGASAILASDYGSGIVGPEVLDALRELKEAGTSLCGDSRYRLRQFVGFSMVKPNEPELEAASGVSLETGGVDRAARVLQRRLGCDELLVTRGKNGLSLFRRGLAPVHIPAYGRKDAVDVTGAGDTVGATYTAGIAAGADPRMAARLANVAGALVVQKPGTATVSNEELRQELARG
jgi:D-glycero-beta-D-manno-heptose-7-phosphate kinase